MLPLLIFIQHCSTSAPSLCTVKYVRQYFVDGTLPQAGTVCQPNLGPFDTIEENLREDAQGRLHMNMNEEDEVLLSAILELSSLSFTSFRPPF